MNVSRVMRSEFEEWAAKLMSIGFNLGEDAVILRKEDERIYACYLNGGDTRCVDITGSAYPVKGALIGLNAYNCAIVSRPHYTCTAAESNEAIPAVLDDMAQIVGPSVAVVPSDRFSIRAALKSCAAIVTERGELITCGRSAYEAYTCLTVTEKNSEIFLKSSVLGGATPINSKLAAAEHLFYLKKYSKAENDKRTKKIEEAETTAPDAVREPGRISRIGKSARGAISTRIAKSANDGRISRVIDKLDERGEDSRLARIANRIGDKLGRPDVNNEEPLPIEAPAYLQDRFYKKPESPDDQLAQFREQFNPFALSESDLEAAELLVAYGKKLVATGLVQGTWGNISIKLDDTYMLCTPSGLDYETLEATDMIKVDYHTHEYEGPHKPTSEKNLHAGIYRSREDVGAIIHTHSKYCSIFAACNTTMEASDNTEVRCAAYGISGTEKLAQNTFRALGKNRACFMSHHGMVAVGADIEEALKNCALVELTAKNYIEANYEE